MKTIFKNRGAVRFLLVAVLLGVGVVLFRNCKKETVTAPPNQVYIQNYAYNPTPLTVTAGTTVTWTNKDNMAHTVTSDAGTFDSGDIQPGSTYTYTFDSKGTFTYHCTVHPYMHGTVTVQ
jgi:plastocyanin